MLAALLVLASLPIAAGLAMDVSVAAHLVDIRSFRPEPLPPPRIPPLQFWLTSRPVRLLLGLWGLGGLVAYGYHRRFLRTRASVDIRGGQLIWSYRGGLREAEDRAHLDDLQSCVLEDDGPALSLVFSDRTVRFESGTPEQLEQIRSILDP